MNQLEIENYLDELAKKTESDIEMVFNRRLKVILSQLASMYERYADSDGEISWTHINAYNRLTKELERINNELTGAYKEIIKTLQKSTENIYLEGYMRNMYLYEMATGQAMRVTLPTMKLIRQILKNPIDKLTLPSTFEQHRNEITRRINIEISQGVQAGEGYAVMARRLQNAVKFSQHKARTVVRTETGRSRALSKQNADEHASKYTKITGVWLSSLDTKVRLSHRRLDGQETNSEGYFTYGKNKAKAPLLWIGPDQAKLTINCRCVKISKVNGMIPEYRRGRDYLDPEYQRKLAERIDKYTADDAMTYKQALKRAQREIQPPSTTMPYVTYDEWFKKHAG